MLQKRKEIVFKYSYSSISNKPRYESEVEMMNLFAGHIWFPNRKDFEGYTGSKKSILQFLLIITFTEAGLIMVSLLGIVVFLISLLKDINHVGPLRHNIFVAFFIFLQVPLNFILIFYFIFSSLIIIAAIIIRVYSKKKLGTVETKLVIIHSVYEIYFFLASLFWVISTKIMNAYS